MKGFPPPCQKHCSLKEAGFSVATPQLSRKLIGPGFENKTKLKPWEVLQCGVLSLSYKEKKLSGTKSVQPTDPQVLPCDFSV